MGLPADVRPNLTLGYYDAGHMMYANKVSLVQLKKDLAHFIESALPAK
jgi:carboxypeptidase C (cathepsin A)